MDAGYKNNEHYSCYRYVDDVFFYYNDTKILERAMSAFEHLLHEYKLCISKEKVMIGNVHLLHLFQCPKLRLMRYYQTL